MKEIYCTDISGRVAAQDTGHEGNSPGQRRIRMLFWASSRVSVTLAYVTQLRGFPGSLQRARALSSSHWQAAGARWRLANDYHMAGLTSPTLGLAAHSRLSLRCRVAAGGGSPCRSLPASHCTLRCLGKALDGAVLGLLLPRAL